MAIQNIKYLKRPKPEDVQSALRGFLTKWCKDCKVGLSLIDPIEGYPANAPCPKETWDTCPMILGILAVRKKEEELK